MTIDYNVNEYLRGINGFGLRPCDLIYTAKIAQDTDTSITIPGISTIGAPAAIINKAIVIVTTDDTQLFAAVNHTAAVPGGASFAQSNSSLVSQSLPWSRYLNGGDVLHFITHSTNANISVEVYAAPF